jgi:glucans biosynthesis protein
LEQRERRFLAYQDLEARYHLRPSVWVEPKGDWGKGSVMLVELPTEVETNDNIVAFWRPEQPLQPGRAHTFSYRMSWPDTFRRIGPKARIVRTMAGLSNGDDRKQGAVQFVLEYGGAGAIAEEDDAPVPVLAASHGRVSKAQVQPNRESGTLRVAFKFYPGANETSELRVAMPGFDGGAEIWLYRWTKGMHQ